MKPTILHTWACGVCETDHDTEDLADECCSKPKPTEWWNCALCESPFFSENEAKDHVSEKHPDESPSSVTQAYLDTLRFGGKPVLGEWAATMAAETEFLIPND